MYAIVDADGAFDSAGRGKSYVHGSYPDRERAISAARRQRQVQVIACNEPKGSVVYADAVGVVYPSVWRRGDDR